MNILIKLMNLMDNIFKNILVTKKLLQNIKLIEKVLKELYFEQPRSLIEESIKL